MKKFVSLLCVICCLFCSTVVFAEGNIEGWGVDEFVDEFGDPIGEKLIKASITGSFSNTATTDSELSGYVFFDLDTYYIRLFEYGRNKAVFFSDNAILKYKVDGAIYSSEIFVNKKSNELELHNVLHHDSFTQITECLRQGTDVRCIITIDSSKYSFTLSPIGFPDGYSLLTYEWAEKLLAWGDNEKAEQVFLSLGSFSDSAKRVEKIRESKYAEGEKYFSDGDYEAAEIVFAELEDYKDSKQRIDEIHQIILKRDYEKALALYDAGEYPKSYDILSRMSDYQDAEMLLQAIIEISDAKRETYKQVGNIVTYGHYGQEPIEWIVIKHDSSTGRSLLFSRYGLDVHSFNSVNYPGWAKSEMRNWLNNTFCSSAFTNTEQQSIVMTSVRTDGNDKLESIAKKAHKRYESVSGGQVCEDKLFLLSYEEIMEYIGCKTLEDFFNKQGTTKLMTSPTAYALANGAYASDSHEIDGVGCCWWWVRSPYTCGDLAAMIDCDGSLSYSVPSQKGAVRPAFWLDVDTAVFY